MGKTLSWKWKIAIFALIFLLFMIAFLFSSSGQDWMERKIIERYQETPIEERRDSSWADRYLKLAWWRSMILQDSESAIKMYNKFCGLPEKAQDDSVFQTWKLKSPLCSEDGKTGWGPMHPRAPEAYFTCIELCEPLQSSQFTNRQCANYYQLFYAWMLHKSPDHKVHPYFNKYWPKIKDMILKHPNIPIPNIDLRAPLAPPAPKEESS